MPTGPQRLRQAIDAAASEDRAALLVCLPYPENVSWSLAAARTCIAAGADMLEFQIRLPVSPLPVVEAVGTIAAAVDVPCILWSDFDTVYAFAILDSSPWPLVPACEAAGIAGIAAPVPSGYGEAFAEACGPELAPIAFVGPSMEPDHFDEVCGVSSAFACAIGTTTPPTDPDVFEDFASFVERVRESSRSPVFVGAGVTTPPQAALAATFDDGVAVAKAVWRSLDAAARHRSSQLDALDALVRMLRRAVERRG